AVTRHHVDRSSGVTSKFGREISRLDINLTHKVDAYIVYLTVIAAGIEVESAVDRQKILIPAGTIDRLVDAKIGHRRELIVPQQRNTGNKRCQLHVVATVQRQILHLLLVDSALKFARSRVYGFTHARRNLDGLRQLSDFQRHVRRYTRVRGEHYPALLRSLK